MSVDLNIKGHLKKLYLLMSDLKHNIMERTDANSSQRHIENIVTDLEQVVSTTESEVEKILDQVDQLNKIAAISPSPAKDQIEEVARIICEASYFQDINGQRVTRVVNALGKISAYIDFVNRKATETGKAAEFSFEDKDEAAELLQGPKAATDENQQDLVDSFFADNFDKK